MSEDLKPCPFCGGLPISAYIRNGRHIVCQTCHAEGPPAYGGPLNRRSAEDRARAAWNTRRAPSSTLRGE